MKQSGSWTPRLLAGFAALVLITTAAFHATGYRPLAESVSASSLPPFFRRAIPGVWLFFSWHLVALALALIWAALRSSRAHPLVWFIALVVFVDTLFVYSLAGFFAGTGLMAAASVCLVIAAMRWPVSLS